jgi:uncharacterized protein
LRDKTPMGLIGNLFTIAFLAAFVEELFFRGMLQQTLTEAKLNHHIAIWITAAVFSAIHIQFYGFLPRMFLGAILGYLFFYTGSIWVSIAAHFVNNALVVLVGYFSDNVKLNPLENGGDEIGMKISPALAALSFMLVLGVIILLSRMKKNADTTDGIV